MKRTTVLLVVAVIALVAGAGLVGDTTARRSVEHRRPGGARGVPRGDAAAGELLPPRGGEQFRAALARDPDFVAARLQLGNALSTLGQKEAAAAEKKLALAADGTKLAGQETRDVGDRPAVRRAAQRRDPSDARAIRRPVFPRTSTPPGRWPPTTPSGARATWP